MSNYKTLGLPVSKYNQILSLVLSLLLLIVNYILGSSLSFWTILIIGLMIINGISFLFSDVKWDKNNFVIEKLFKRTEIRSQNFIEIDKLLFNINIIKFTDCKFYYLSDIRSFFTSSVDITNEIKSDLEQCK